MGARTQRHVARPATAWAVLLSVALAGPAAAAPGASLSEQEARGKAIFLTGESPSGRDITAYVGQAAVAVSASAMPCASCHGSDGLGRPEGGVIPSDITWRELTKSYGAVSPSGRARPAYTEQSLARAIRTGMDAGDARLDVSMPRFRMHAEDMADLIAYLKRLEQTLDPGLSETAITLGTLLPEGERSAAFGAAVKQVILAYFADINAQGGIYRRRLELKAMGAPTRDLVLARGQALIESGEVFALVAAMTLGLEHEFDSLIEQRGVPLIGPFTAFPPSADALHRFTFYLYGGLGTQAQALSHYASTKLVPGGARIGVVYPGDEKIRAVAQALQAQAKTRQRPLPLLREYPKARADAAAVAAELEREHIDTLLFLGDGAALEALVSAGASRGWTPYVLTPGVLAGEAVFDLPPAVDGRVFLAYPTGPADYSKAGAEEFNEFRRRHGLAREHTTTQIAAYAAVKLLAEGLKAAGRGLSREKLVLALESLYQFETGLTPKLTYGPNRRIGARGAHIVKVDLQNKRLHPGATWVEAD